MRFRRLLKKFVNVIQRRFPTDEHRKAWDEDYDKILRYRANFTFLTKIAYFIMFVIMGSANYQKSDDFKEDGGVYNKEFAAST